MADILKEAGQDLVKVNVSNSRNENVAFEMKFFKNITIVELKMKLEIITGASAGAMNIELYNGDRLVTQLSNNEAQLGSYPIETGMRLHVIDNSGWAADENVEKFELSDEQYESKSDTVRNFLKRNNLGKYDEESARRKEEKRQRDLELERQKSETCTIGARCEIRVPGNPTRRGTIQYNGPLEGKNGIFIGVRYDEPLGKNNGSIDGKIYFVCPPKYGGFISPLMVEVGDFPPEDDGICDEI